MSNLFFAFNKTVNESSSAPALSQEQQHYLDAIDSALGILFFYEDDEYEFLAEESVITDLIDNYNYSSADAHSILANVSAIHEYRMLTGFYN